MRNSAIIVLCCLGCSSAAAMPGGEPAAGLGDHCQEVEAPCIRQWTEMSKETRKLRRDERQLLRQQITEFHVQLTGSGEGRAAYAAGASMV